MTRAQWFGNFTLTETYRPLLGGIDPLLLNRVAWALCYQEQFYLVCFLALLIAPKRLPVALGLATLLIVLYQLISWDIGRSHYSAGLFPDLWHEFAVGPGPLLADQHRRIDSGEASGRSRFRDHAGHWPLSTPDDHGGCRSLWTDPALFLPVG